MDELTFDHFAVAAQNLNEGAAWLQDRLGAELQPGGKHPLPGTHNMLLSLGAREYLELIAMDPDAPPNDNPGWFGLKTFTGPPRIAGWVLRQSPLKAPAGTYVAQVTRANLRWRITLPEAGQMPGDGTTPMRIKWSNDAHPCDTLPDHGFRLAGLTVHAPSGLYLPIPDPRIAMILAPAGITARITTPDGEVRL